MRDSESVSGSHNMSAADAVTRPQVSGLPLPVSVIVPAFNRERVLRETLDTIVAQTRLPSEVMIVDDGSTDGTAEVAETWAKEVEARIGIGVRVLRQANGGAAAARNAGVRAAEQPWIAFLDSDDLWAPEKLELQWEVVQADSSVTCIFTDMTQFRESGAVVIRSFLSRYSNYQRVQRRPLRPSAFRLERGSLAREFLVGNFINPSTLLVRRDLVEQTGPMVEGMAPCEDREFLLRLLTEAETAVVGRPVVHYRMHPQNISGNTLAMALCTVELANMIERSPDRYVEGAVEVFRSRRPGLLREAGMQSLRQGRFDRAREYFGRSLSERWSLRTLAGLLLACGGPRAYSFVVRLRRIRRRRLRGRGADGTSSPT